MTTELDALLSTDEAPYDWVVPGLLERGDRVILTGAEGHGKSTLLRQVAVQLASGIHPFGGDDLDPLRVWLVDLENGRRHVRRSLSALRAAAGDQYAGGLLVDMLPGGIDVVRGDGPELLARAGEARPDVMVVGPLYKLAGGDPTEEGTAREAARWLDHIRRDVGCVVLLEAHSPHAANGGRRPERPYGASLWLRWPEFGVYLSPNGHLRHWRGPRDDRAWPAALQRGGLWPWSPVTRERDLLWNEVARLCGDAGDQLSYRDLATLTKRPVNAVQRAVGEHKMEWDALAYAQLKGVVHP